MQRLMDKLFGDMPMEERWVEILAYGGAAWFCVLFAAAGFMLGPIFTPWNNDPNFPGRAHYSLEGAAICFVLGAIISGTLLVGRVRAKRWEEAHHAHESSVLEPTVTDLDPEPDHGPKDSYL